jgi:hypothetical protein
VASRRNLGIWVSVFSSTIRKGQSFASLRSPILQWIDLAGSFSYNFSSETFSRSFFCFFFVLGFFDLKPLRGTVVYN